jgi:hypothetical protein
MEVGEAFQKRIAGWETLSRWERSELGKDLRRLGLSYGEIMDLIPVKKSTLATWCRDIRLNEKQIEEMKTRRPPIPGVPRNTQRKRHREIEMIQAQAKLEAIHLQDDPLWTMGVALYWAEGTKSSRRLELAHSEPEALRLFMSWARIYLRSDATFGAAINLHFDNDEPAAKKYWSTELGIDPARFTKTFIKPDGTGHRKNHLPTGVCRVTMKRSTDAFITTLAWVDFIRESFQN